MREKLATFVLCLLLSGCVSVEELINQPGMPGYIIEKASVYDAGRQLRMEPAWLLETTNLKLGLYWRTAMGNMVLVTATVVGMHSFDPQESLSFKVDGKVIKLRPAHKHDYGDIETKNWGSAGLTNDSRKDFISDKYFIDEILAAKTVLVRAELLKTFVEGRFSLDSPERSQIQEQVKDTVAFYAFQKFRSKAWGQTRTENL
jgi:hypothetical protein